MIGLLGLPALRAFGQGVSTRAVKAQPRGKPSGLPFNACFTDIAAQAGLNAPLIYGPAEKKTYILETSAADAPSSITTTTAGSIFSC